MRVTPLMLAIMVAAATTLTAVTIAVTTGSGSAPACSGEDADNANYRAIGLNLFDYAANSAFDPLVCAPGTEDIPSYTEWVPGWYLKALNYNGTTQVVNGTEYLRLSNSGNQQGAHHMLSLAQDVAELTGETTAWRGFEALQVGVQWDENTFEGNYTSVPLTVNLPISVVAPNGTIQQDRFIAQAKASFNNAAPTSQLRLTRGDFYVRDLQQGTPVDPLTTHLLLKDGIVSQINLVFDQTAEGNTVLFRPFQAHILSDFRVVNPTYDPDSVTDTRDGYGVDLYNDYTQDGERQTYEESLVKTDLTQHYVATIRGVESVVEQCTYTPAGLICRTFTFTSPTPGVCDFGITTTKKDVGHGVPNHQQYPVVTARVGVYDYSKMNAPKLQAYAGELTSWVGDQFQTTQPGYSFTLQSLTSDGVNGTLAERLGFTPDQVHIAGIWANYLLGTNETTTQEFLDGIASGQTVYDALPQQVKDALIRLQQVMAFIEPQMDWTQTQLDPAWGPLVEFLLANSDDALMLDTKALHMLLAPVYEAVEAANIDENWVTEFPIVDVEREALELQSDPQSYVLRNVNRLMSGEVDDRATEIVISAAIMGAAFADGAVPDDQHIVAPVPPTPDAPCLVRTIGPIDGVQIVDNALGTLNATLTEVIQTIFETEEAVQRLVNECTQFQPESACTYVRDQAVWAYGVVEEEAQHIVNETTAIKEFAERTVQECLADKPDSPCSDAYALKDAAERLAMGCVGAVQGGPSNGATTYERCKAVVDLAYWAAEQATSCANFEEGTPCKDAANTVSECTDFEGSDACAYAYDQIQDCANFRDASACQTVRDILLECVGLASGPCHEVYQAVWDCASQNTESPCDAVWNVVNDCADRENVVCATLMDCSDFAEGSPCYTAKKAVEDCQAFKPGTVCYTAMQTVQDCLDYEGVCAYVPILIELVTSCPDSALAGYNSGSSDGSPCGDAGKQVHDTLEYVDPLVDQITACAYNQQGQLEECETVWDCSSNATATGACRTAWNALDQIQKTVWDAVADCTANQGDVADGDYVGVACEAVYDCVEPEDQGSTYNMLEPCSWVGTWIQDCLDGDPSLWLGACAQVQECVDNPMACGGADDLLQQAIDVVLGALADACGYDYQPGAEYNANACVDYVKEQVDDKVEQVEDAIRDACGDYNGGINAPDGVGPVNNCVGYAVFLVNVAVAAIYEALPDCMKSDPNAQTSAMTCLEPVWNLYEDVLIMVQQIIGQVPCYPDVVAECIDPTVQTVLDQVDYVEQTVVGALEDLCKGQGLEQTQSTQSAGIAGSDDGGAKQFDPNTCVSLVSDAVNGAIDAAFQAIEDNLPCTYAAPSATQTMAATTEDSDCVALVLGAVSELESTVLGIVYSQLEDVPCYNNVMGECVNPYQDYVLQQVAYALNLVYGYRDQVIDLVNSYCNTGDAKSECVDPVVDQVVVAGVQVVAAVTSAIYSQCGDDTSEIQSRCVTPYEQEVLDQVAAAINTINDRTPDCAKPYTAAATCASPVIETVGELEGTVLAMVYAILGDVPCYNDVMGACVDPTVDDAMETYAGLMNTIGTYENLVLNTVYGLCGSNYGAIVAQCVDPTVGDLMATIASTEAMVLNKANDLEGQVMQEYEDAYDTIYGLLPACAKPAGSAASCATPIVAQLMALEESLVEMVYAELNDVPCYNDLYNDCVYPYRDLALEEANYVLGLVSGLQDTVNEQVARALDTVDGVCEGDVVGQCVNPYKTIVLNAVNSLSRDVTELVEGLCEGDVVGNCVSPYEETVIDLVNSAADTVLGLCGGGSQSRSAASDCTGLVNDALATAMAAVNKLLDDTPPPTIPDVPELCGGDVSSSSSQQTNAGGGILEDCGVTLPDAGGSEDQCAATDTRCLTSTVKDSAGGLTGGLA